MEALSEQQIRCAMDEQKFFMRYQPKIDVGTLQVVGAEALSRCLLPDGRVVRAAQFISQMEKCGLDIEFGDQVVAAVCQQIAQWRDKGLTPRRVSVNLSQKQFEHPDFLEKLLAALHKYDIPPHLFGVEIKEATTVHDPDHVNAQLHALENMGVAISVDDFGSGIVGKDDLEDFPLHMIKIDRPFIAGLPDDEICQAIVSATLAIAGALQVKTLAEGVETREQLAFLREAGCDQAQGHLFSHAVSAEEFEEYLRNPDVSARVHGTAR